MSIGSFPEAIELPGCRDRGMKQGGINRSPKPNRAGIGQLDCQLSACAEIKDRYGHEVGDRAADRRNGIT